jgi:hypothetical protein
MKDALIRAVRTFIQAFLGVFLGLVAASSTGVSDVPDVSELRAAAMAAGFAALIAMLAWIQNALEASTGKALLK